MTELVAIDGPAGSGKSSVSKQAAREVGFGYLDTGAAYRALAWAVLEGQFQLDDLASISLDNEFDYSISTDPDDFWVRVGETDVTAAIREQVVAEYVSQVARIPEVRAFMKRLTHRLVAESGRAGMVVEGRDITTVVAPDAKIRLLLTASEEVRLKRRSAELSPQVAAEVHRQVSQRDQSDSKVVDFMTPAPGVVLVDSTELNFEQTVAAVRELIERGLAQ
ncbi:MAG: (d)CMP kinase [Actinomycetales bacterium]|nr:(d)CMP kinase [Actinomycetales bacterium]